MRQFEISLTIKFDAELYGVVETITLGGERTFSLHDLENESLFLAKKLFTQIISARAKIIQESGDAG